jgi:hypothetical protein
MPRADDGEPLAGEIIARTDGHEVACAVCCKRARGRAFDPSTLGARVMPACEGLPKGWTLLLDDPPLPICSEACSLRRVSESCR